VNIIYGSRKYWKPNNNNNNGYELHGTNVKRIRDGLKIELDT
jgi:hypothetical protein